MATFQVTPPESFNFKNSEEFDRWLSRFERFRIASGLNDKSGEQQVNTLIYCMGREADDIFQSFNLTNAQQKQYDGVKKKFQDHFVIRRNVIFERAKFNMRKQEDGESVDTFITALYTLAEHCKFGTLKNELIRDRIVVGLRDARIAEKLQLDAELTLEKAINQARQSESIKKQQSVVRPKSDINDNDSKVDVVRKKNFVKHKSVPGKAQNINNRPNTRSKCTRCGAIPEHSRKNCPAAQSVCRGCGIKGHWQKCCLSKKHLHEVEEDASTAYEQDKYAYLGTIDEVQSSSPWYISLKIKHMDIQFKIDTGADLTVLSDDVYVKLGKFPLAKSTRKLFGPGQMELNVLGKFTETISSDTKSVQEEIYVVKGLKHCLLGRPTIEKLGLVKRIYEVYTPETIKQKYPKLFQGLGKLDGQYNIQLKDDAKPYALTVPRRVSIPHMSKVKTELDRMEETGVISKISEPTEWCAGMVVVPKANGNVRICVDLTKLNESVKRENFPMPAIDQTLGLLSGALYFSKIDCNSSFWQCELSESCRHLTCFITPFGRYVFNRLPFGLSSSSEYFQKRICSILDGVPGVVCQTDDVLIFGKTEQEHDERLDTVLRRFQDSQLTLNVEKCVFKTRSVKYVGFIIGPDGVRVDPEKLSAFVDMEPPSDVSGVRRILGVINHMGKFSSNLAEYTKPLRDLLKDKNQFYWGHPQQNAFNKIKEELTKSPVLALYDPTRYTVVASDASNYGIGTVIMQKQDDGLMKPVAYASRALTPTEQRYATIEKEGLGITWACERFRDFLIGKQFHIETDHKPLVSLFGCKDISELSSRIQRFRMRLMDFTYTISHVEGRKMVISDALSRAPLYRELSTKDEQACIDIENYVDYVISSLPVTDTRLREIIDNQTKDTVCRKLINYCENGWPERKSDLPEFMKTYWSIRGEITVNHGLLMKGSRIIIPSSMQADILSKIHGAHQGITKCRDRANNSVYWPGLSKDIEDMVRKCDTCSIIQNDHAEPMIYMPLPGRPWEKLGTDMFYWKGQNYLLVIDYYSRYIEIAKLTSTTSSDVISHLKSIMSRHGVCDTLVSDGAGQFTSELFEQFMRDFGIKHVLSSPHWPLGNSESERAVQTVKHLLEKADDPYVALMEYRASKIRNGYSPSELLFNRQIKTLLPTAPGNLQPKLVNATKIAERENYVREQTKLNYDNRRRARPLQPLEEGDRVHVKNLKTDGNIVQSALFPRSYIVDTPRGTIRRNRRHLVKLHQPSSADDTPVHQPISADDTPVPREICRENTGKNNNSMPVQTHETLPEGATLTRSGCISKPPERLQIQN